jgi:hypothetical protein
MTISLETKNLADSLFIHSVAQVYGRFVEKMPTGAELAEASLKLAIEYDKYFEDVVITEPSEEEDGLLTIEDIKDNLAHFLPGGVAPKNEKELVDLFRLMSEDYFGFTRCEIQTRFPDCIAQREGQDPIRIEFEYNASNFSLHTHDRSGCDALFCWINDWPGAPDGIEVVELQRLFGFGFNAWIQGAKDRYAEAIGQSDEGGLWSVSRRAQRGDLVLFYRKLPEGFIADIYLVAGEVRFVEEAGWKDGSDWMAPIKRVCALGNPLSYETMKTDRRLRDSGLVKSQLQGRPKVSSNWAVLLEMIVERNADLAWLRNVYGPDKLGQAA